MNDNLGDLDSKIKAKFKLFSGVRSREEDEKIYDKVYELCFDEMAAFLGENLDDAGREALTQDLEKQETEEDKTRVLLTSLTKIENYASKLDQRMDEYLDDILQSSLANLNN